MIPSHIALTCLNSIRFAQSAGLVLYQLGLHFESIRLQILRCSFQVQKLTLAPRCTMTPQHRNKLTLLDPFWDPKNHKKVTRTIF